MLRLVHPAPKGQETRTSKKKRFKTNFPPAQAARIRALLRNLRTAYGSWECLAAVTGYAKTSLSSAATKPERASYSFVVQLARAAGMTVEEVLSPRLAPVVGCCPTCGRKGAK